MRVSISMLMLMLILMAMFMILVKGPREEGMRGPRDKVTKGPWDQGIILHSTILSKVKRENFVCGWSWSSLTDIFHWKNRLGEEFLKAAFTLGTGRSREVRLVAETTKVLPVNILDVSLCSMTCCFPQLRAELAGKRFSQCCRRIWTKSIANVCPIASLRFLIRQLHCCAATKLTLSRDIEKTVDLSQSVRVFDVDVYSARICSLQFCDVPSFG